MLQLEANTKKKRFNFQIMYDLMFLGKEVSADDMRFLCCNTYDTGIKGAKEYRLEFVYVAEDGKEHVWTLGKGYRTEHELPKRVKSLWELYLRMHSFSGRIDEHLNNEGVKYVDVLREHSSLFPITVDSAEQLKLLTDDEVVENIVDFKAER